ncbi:CgeB family protein [Terrisporobacter vanillatitrophus]|uniref:CgeB family protein n=1 Tax=Terrisporobacter vanillatitrophus TaxID=3058402 RepID=UPI003368097D
MKFKSANKLIYSYKYDKKNLITHHVINNVKLFNQYQIIFGGNKNENLSLINIKLYCNNNEIENILLYLNQSYKFDNKDVTKIEIDVDLKEDMNFNLNILELPIVFEENTYENSSIVNDFINDIENMPIIKDSSSPTFNIKMACILDEFTYECFSPECNLLQLKSMTWKNQIEEFQPDFLFVESAWYGVCKTWIGKIACEEKLDDTLLELVTYCNTKKIPTVFFNKEGLVNLFYFEKSSAIFDYVFVSDENIIPSQIELCNHPNVYPLSFAAQPKIHNSINKNKYKLGDVAFAGGWYSNKHDNRLKDFEYILKPALDYNIHIYDRNFHQRSMFEFLDKYWPKEYLDNIVGRLDYKYMVEAYKNYTVFLNVNSIHDSSYMVSRRVYEILACKTLLLSSYSKGIVHNFKDYVFISNSPDETKYLLQDILENSSVYEKKAKESQRYILENHTYANRLMEVFNITNLNYNKTYSINVAVICVVEDSSHIKNIYKNLINQYYTPSYTYLFINKKINWEDCKDFLNIKNLYYNFYTNEKDINHLFEYIYNLKHNITNYALLYSSNYYGPNYIRDYVNILSYSNLHIIGKSQIYEVNNNELELKICDNKDSYVRKIYKDTLFFTKTFLSFLSYNDDLSSSCISRNNFIFYSDDEYNFLRNVNLNLQDYIKFITI